ncbi:hypothetical protein PBRA_003121 [Plasmodiophora brassicae]|uniref:PNPLA domain-containing protein n=1 Tax=Plasmodiophora brassicae TaxID=37360 RepID=A0A0G4J7U7_PLABS|nr:hypothetical protein PBRA_003121 [Plasmodiophora brassicae]
MPEISLIWASVIAATAAVFIGVFLTPQAVRTMLLSLSWLMWIFASILSISLQWVLVMWVSIRICITMVFFAWIKVTTALVQKVVCTIERIGHCNRPHATMIKESADRIKHLSAALRNVTSYEEWYRIGKEIDKLDDRDEWSQDPYSDLYDAELLMANSANFKRFREQGNIRDLVFTATGALPRSFCGITNEGLYTKRFIGTKDAIEEFIRETKLCVDVLHKTPMLTPEEKLAFFESASLTVGHTALCLSGGGSLSMYHMGVVKALLEGNALPRYISGTSGGSIVCAVVGMYTDEELLNDIIREDIAKRYGVSWFEPMASQVLHFATRGVLMDNGFFANTCKAYFKDTTFEEAHHRTGRVITITLTKSTRAERDSDANVVLLNYVTSPHVLIRSAVEASCALPGLMNPVELLAKDSQGRIKKYYPSGARFVDGSLSADVPMRRLSQLFNTSHFIVSQVNPHVAPFVSRLKKDTCNDGLLSRLQRLAVNDLKSSARKLAKLRLIPNIFVLALRTNSWQSSLSLFVYPDHAV